MMNIPLSKIPIMPLREVVLFPRGIIPLLVGRELTIRAIGRAVSYHSRKIFMVTQRDPVTWDIRSRSELFKIGTVAKILEIVEAPQPNALRVLFEGLYRARFIPHESSDAKHGSRKVTSLANVYPFEERSYPVSEQRFNEFLSALNAYILKSEKPASKVIERILNKDITFSQASPGILADMVLQYIGIGYRKKQELLELANGVERMNAVYALLQDNN